MNLKFTMNSLSLQHFFLFFSFYPKEKFHNEQYTLSQLVSVLLWKFRVVLLSSYEDSKISPFTQKNKISFVLKKLLEQKVATHFILKYIKINQRPTDPYDITISQNIL